MPSQSALIVPVPEAEPVVCAHRARLDSSAAQGVPAHVTVLYPFLPPTSLNAPLLDAVARIAAGVPAFFLRLTGLSWFGDRVVWLAPDPASPFVTLTAALTRRFPSAQPYNGEHDEVIPHLTLGHDHPVADLRAAADDVAQHLPIVARAAALRLIVGGPSTPWTTLTEFPFGRAS